MKYKHIHNGKIINSSEYYALSANERLLYKRVEEESESTDYYNPLNNIIMPDLGISSPDVSGGSDFGGFGGGDGGGGGASGDW